MSVLVTTPYGKVEGFEEGGLNKFYGIPYAKAPVGDLRFRHAQEPEPWEGVLEAKVAAKNPMQVEAENTQVINLQYFSEDCLYLNVWAPKNAKNLPVMVWIPGGGFQVGGAGRGIGNNAPVHDCTKLALNGDCVIVSFSYRVGAFGFMNFGLFSDKFDNNNGMSDQLAVLKWVKKCISAFGGDPDNVTIFGVSAGGTSVAALLMMPDARPYYQKAIMESSVMESFFTEDEEKERCQVFFEKVGIEDKDVDKILEMEPEKIIEGFQAAVTFTFNTYFPSCITGPMVDGKYVKMIPSLMDASELKDKQIMIGNNQREGDFYTQDNGWAATKLNRYKFGSYAFRNFRGKAADDAYDHYHLPDVDGFSDLLRDIWYTAPKLQVAEKLSKYTNVYIYQFTYATPNMHEWGYNCCHSAELLPLFDQSEGGCEKMTMAQIREGYEEEFALVGDVLRNFWSSFAHTGKPVSETGYDEDLGDEDPKKGVVKADEWKPYDKRHRYTMILPQGRLEQDAEKEIREIYKDVCPISRRASRYEKYKK